MSWTPPRRANVGDLYTAAWVNEIEDDLSYLHGDAGQIALDAGIQISDHDSGSGGNNAIVILHNTVAGKSPYVYCPDTGVFEVGYYGGIGGVLQVDSTGKVKANGRVVQTRADGVIGHEEAGLVSTGGGTIVTKGWLDSTVVFTDPFATKVNVVAGVQASAGADGALNAVHRSPTVSGFTHSIFNTDTVTRTYVNGTWNASGDD